MPCRTIHRLLCLNLALGLSWPTAVHANPLSLVHQQAEESVAILGLEGDDAVAAEAFSNALRRAFASRGVSSAQRMSVVEFRLTMGCEGDDVACFTEGARALDVQRLIYGSLTKSDGGYMFSMRIVDVTSGETVRHTSQRVSAAELSPEKIDATATAIVATLLAEPVDEKDIVAPAEPTTVPVADSGTSGAKPRGDKRYVWGRVRPAPTWKVAGLGASAGLMAVSLGTAIGLSVTLRTKLRNDLLDAADRSLVDENPLNDVSRSEPDLCAAGRMHPPEDTSHPNSVRNASITRVCNRADGVQIGQYVAWSAFGVFAASTIVFTTLLYVHKNKPGAQALRRHQMRFGAAPTGGGWALAGAIKF